MDNETLYFMKAARYPAATARILRATLEAYDALFCVGDFQSRLAREVVGEKARTRILTIPSAVSASRSEMLRRVTPSLEGQTLLFIGNGPADWRIWYKGLDLLLAAHEQLSATRPQLELVIVGDWAPKVVSEYQPRDRIAAVRVHFAGSQQDLRPWLERASLYVHLGRGEAFGISILEAMSAGVPAVVSELTGASEVVRRVHSGMVVKPDATAAAVAIDSYFNASPDERRRLSALARRHAECYTEAAAVAAFQSVVAATTNHDRLRSPGW
jgi:glycosyltransferase involved in cell wall biosynthesis